MPASPRPFRSVGAPSVRGNGPPSEARRARDQNWTFSPALPTTDQLSSV